MEEALRFGPVAIQRQGEVDLVVRAIGSRGVSGQHKSRSRSRRSRSRSSEKDVEVATLSREFR